MEKSQTDGRKVTDHSDAPGTGKAVPRIAVGAFLQTPDVAGIIEAAAADRRMARANVSVRAGGIAAATALYKQMPPPNLIIVESNAAQDTLFGELEELAHECLPDTKVLVIGPSNDVDLFRALLQRGVSDYLVTPLDAMSLIAAVSRLFHDTAGRRLGRVVAFIGARGGAGSSTIAENVALSLAEALDTDILLADLDLPFGTVGLDLNVDPVQGVSEVLQSSDRIDEVLLDRLSTKRHERLQILAATSAMDKAYDLKDSDLEKLMDVAQSSARHLVLDLPQAWTSWTKKTLQSADEIVITATPDLVSMRNTKHMIEFLTNMRPNDAPPRLVLNQVGVPKRPEIKPADFAAAVRLQPSIRIAFEPLLFGAASNDGRAVVEAAAKSLAAQSLRDFSSMIGGRKEMKNAPRSMGSLMGRLVGKR